MAAGTGANQNQSQDENGEREYLLEEARVGVGKVKKAWQGFKDFALRDNVLEVAVGLIIASAFTNIVNSLISDIILPPISLLPLIDRNLPEKFAVLRHGFNESAVYNTLEQAHDDGAVTLNYGLFINKLINFFGLGVVLYALANLYGAMTDDSIISHTTRCVACRKEISVSAKRCAFCTTWQDGRETS